MTDLNIEYESFGLVKIIENLDSLPFLQSYLKLRSAYQYELLLDKKPHKGDFDDLKHFTVAAKVDMIIADDDDFLRILKYVYPAKPCLKTENFLHDLSAIEKNNQNINNPISTSAPRLYRDNY